MTTRSEAFVKWARGHWFPLSLTVMLLATMLSVGRYRDAAMFSAFLVAGFTAGRALS